MLPDCLRAICFDIGGVLVQPQRGFLAEELAEAIGADLALVRRLLIEHGKRRRIDPPVLAAALAMGCGAQGDAGRIEEILRWRLGDMAAPVLYPDAIPVLETLRAAGWRLCFLSNAICGIEDRPRPAYFCFAEIVVHSWAIGYCKPEVEAFRAVEKGMGLAPHQMVSIGDSLRSDVLGALDAGWSTVHLPRTSAVAPPQYVVPTIISLFDLLTLMPPSPSRIETRGSAGL